MNILEQRRTELGISESDIANILGVTEEDYKLLESDLQNANAYLVYKACSVLGIDYDSIEKDDTDSFKKKIIRMVLEINDNKNIRIVYHFVHGVFVGGGY